MASYAGAEISGKEIMILGAILVTGYLAISPAATGVGKGLGDIGGGVGNLLRLPGDIWGDVWGAPGKIWGSMFG